MPTEIITVDCMEAGADLGFYKDECPIHLKGVPEVERRRHQGGMGSGRGLCPSPLPRLFLISYIKW